MHKKHQKTHGVLSLNKTAASKTARMIKGTLHSKEVVMQQVDTIFILVAEVRITFTLVAWIATLVSSAAPVPIASAETVCLLD